MCWQDTEQVTAAQTSQCIPLKQGALLPEAGLEAGLSLPEPQGDTHVPDLLLLRLPSEVVLKEEPLAWDVRWVLPILIVVQVLGNLLPNFFLHRLRALLSEAGSSHHCSSPAASPQPGAVGHPPARPRSAARPSPLPWDPPSHSPSPLWPPTRRNRCCPASAPPWSFLPRCNPLPLPGRHPVTQMRCISNRSARNLPKSGVRSSNRSLRNSLNSGVRSLFQLLDMTLPKQTNSS